MQQCARSHCCTAVIHHAHERVAFIAANRFTDFQIAARNGVKRYVGTVFFQYRCTQERQCIALSLFNVAKDGIDAGKNLRFVFKSSCGERFQSKFFFDQCSTALAVKVPVGKRCHRNTVEVVGSRFFDRFRKKNFAGRYASDFAGKVSQRTFACTEITIGKC